VSGFPSNGALHRPCFAALQGDAEFRDGIDFQGIREKIGTGLGQGVRFRRIPCKSRLTRRYQAQNSLLSRLIESLKKFVDAQIASKGYGDVSEYFRSLLREAQAKEENARLQALLLEGLASDRIPLTDPFWADLKAEAAQLLNAQQSGKKNG